MTVAGPATFAAPVDPEVGSGSALLVASAVADSEGPADAEADPVADGELEALPEQADTARRISAMSGRPKADGVESCAQGTSASPPSEGS